MKIEYQTCNFRNASLALIEQANEIIDEYMAEGYELTLRQIYYQFVARNLFPEDRRWIWTGRKWRKDPNGTKNAEPNYKWLGGFINDGRLAGLIDWSAIVDRTREIDINSHWDSPEEILQSTVYDYALDTRATQSNYIEVWVEKEALAGILIRACEPLDVASFCCRGYDSQSAMWRAARRITKQTSKDRTIYENETRGLREAIILYLGDHDPSGIDMGRDIQDRLNLFGVDVEVRRIALNYDQIEQYNPPPSPAKTTDSRYESYVSKYGCDESWELDALDPRTINDLITKEINKLTDKKERKRQINLQEQQRQKLQQIADNFENLEV